MVDLVEQCYASLILRDAISFTVVYDRSECLTPLANKVNRNG